MNTDNIQAQEPEKVSKLVHIGTEAQPFKVSCYARKARGEDVFLPVAVLEIETFEELQRLARAVSPSVFTGFIFREALRPLSYEASSDAIGDDGEQTLDLTKWVKSFVDGLQAPSRQKGGPKLKDLLLEMGKLSTELGMLYAKSNTPGYVMSQEEKNRGIQLTEKLMQLSASVAKKQRLGRKPAAEKSA